MKRNKLGILATLALGGLMACGPIARAQDNNPPPPPAAGGTPAQRPPRGARGMQAIFDKLDLTADQKEKIKPLFADQREKLSALRDDTSLSPEDRRAKANAIFEATNAKLKEILTADQYTKFQDLRKQMMSRRGARAGGDGASTSPNNNK